MGLLFVAWRNVFRNKRRTVLNVIALSIGIIMMIIGIGWMRGYETGLFQSMINFETGHIQVLNEKYLDQERRLPLDLMVEHYESVRARLLEDPRVLEVTPRVNFSVTVGFRGKSRPLLGRGIDPAKEGRVTILKTTVVEGDYLDKGPGVLIGKPLADKFGLSVGDTIALTADTKYSSDANVQENFEYARVVGIFYYGYPAIDENIVYLDIGTASRLLRLSDEATRLVVRLKPGFDPHAVLPDLQARLGNTGLRAYSWERFAEVVVSAVQADGSSFGFMFVIIYVLIVIGIRNSMSMSVEERIREIGMLRAIGMKKCALMGLFMAESVWIASIAIVISLILGGIIAILLQYVGFNFGDYMPAEIPIPFGEKFTCDFRVTDFLFAILFATLTALLSGLTPARRAAKIAIARAMGTLAIK